MKALRLTAITFSVALLCLFLWLVMQADQMGGEPTHVFSIQSENKKKQKDTDVSQKEELTPKPEEKKKDKMAALPRPDNVDLFPKDFKQESLNAQRLMASVPVKSLIERTRYGMLPIISQTGRRPFDVYARPFNLPVKVQEGQARRIAIVINGLGISSEATETAIHKLPGAVTLSFNPYGRSLQNWIKKARSLGHEILLEVPLEPYDYPDNDPGPQTLLTYTAKEENLSRLLWVLGRFSGYIGVMNFMGDKFLTSSEAVLPVFRELNRRGLAYFENGHGLRSESAKISKQIGLRYAEAHLKIDTEISSKKIKKNLERLESLALKNGYAVGVASGLPLTMKLLAQWAKTLEKKKIILVPVSVAIRAYDRK